MRCFLKAMGAVVAVVAVFSAANTAQAALVVGATFGSATVVGDISDTVPANQPSQITETWSSGPFASAWTFGPSSAPLGISNLLVQDLDYLSDAPGLEYGLVQGGSQLGSVFSGGTIVAVGVGSPLTFFYANFLSGQWYALVVLATGLGGYAADVTVSAVPLPAAAWLFLSALVGLVGIVRRRSSAADIGTGAAAAA